MTERLFYARVLFISFRQNKLSSLQAKWSEVT